MERCFVLGDNGIVGDRLLAAMLFEDMLAPLLLFTDVFNNLELLICERGIEVEEVEFLNVLTFVSDKDKSFFTASGECVLCLIFA